MKKEQIRIVIITTLISTFSAVAVTQIINTADPNQQKNQQIADYYHNSVATLQSPHGYREQMNRGYTDYILVDTRAHEDYVRGHITGAINIDSNGSTDQVVETFRTLSETSDKPILIYCYSTSCMNGRKVGSLLAKHDIYVHELTIGYNEWEYSPKSWNYPQEWETLSIEEYITRGEEPGELVPKLEELLDGCGIEGELSC